uniref:Si:ch211-243j20.2 n=1 Tax=Neogobius melanostomus TaxID=47308 RepID=A0A8C6TW68_9GOBI
MEESAGNSGETSAIQPPGDGAEADRSMSRSDSGSGDDSLDASPRCPLTPVTPVTSSLSPRKRSTSQSKTEPPLLRTNKRTIYTAGRPPWYNVTGTSFKEAFVIGLCGGSASGKTTVANKIIEALDVPWVVLLSMDSFYKVLNKEQQELAAKNEFNFDHPDAFDFELLVSVLRKLKKGKSIKVPVYDFTSHCRRKEWRNGVRRQCGDLRGNPGVCEQRTTEVVGHEGVRGHGLGHPAHTAAEEGHFSAWQGHQRHH